MRLFKWVMTWCSLVLSITAQAQTKHTIHFEHTDHELHVYEIQGQLPGKTMLIIGGMHNEPGGYVTADLFADIALKKGNLIVVPRANMPAIVNNKRGINNDMNRTFTDKHADAHKHIYEDDIVSVLKQLIAKSDVLLNLHDGYGYYRPQFVSELANPKRWGQAIITDREQFVSNKTGQTLQLSERAKAIVEAVNPLVENQFHRFHYKNTRTKDPNSLHKEQRTSATFYALYEHGIEAYGIETSKNIQSLDLKVSYQTMIVNAFLAEFDIIPEQHNRHLDNPRLSYLLLSINDERPQAYKDGELVRVNKGDEVRIEQAFTNYKRGVIVDLEQNQTLNDIGKTFSVTGPTSIRVLKDQYLAGRVFIDVNDKPDATVKASDTPQITASNTPQLTASDSTQITASNMPQTKQESAHLLVELNGRPQKISHGGSISISETDTLRLINYKGISERQAPSQINLVGFVGNQQSNDGEDRGYLITKSKLIKRFSIDGQGKRYRIKAEQGKLLIAQFFVNTDG